MQKIMVITCRWFVGLLFIFSGLIKANDPLGLSYKMQEFFEAWHVSFLNNISLSSSVLMNILEVIAGVAIIIGFKSKFFTRLLLLLIIFFTFLTSYVLFSGKITACGCFGDCVPLTPIQTFTKDIILLLLIVFITFNYKNINPIFSFNTSKNIIIISILSIGFLQWYVLNHLPFLDCLPYKKGNNILEQMQAPPNSYPDSIAIFYNYKKDGKLIKIDASHFPDDFDSTYVQVGDEEKIIIRKGNNTPKIVDFTLSKLNDNINIASELLNQNKKYVMILVKSFPNKPNAIADFLNMNVLQELQKQYPIYIVTSDVVHARNLFIKDVEFLKLDATVLKTAARVNPTYFLMNGATILNKVSAQDAATLIK
jgi:uncharacterized membrane protein YphA (DoxX/SURF4 family)